MPTSRGSRLAGVPRRHQTLRAALAWSHDLLSEPERLLLRRMAVFAGTFSSDAVREVCAHGQVAAGGVGDILAKLAARFLVVNEVTERGTQYRLHESVRHFAREELTAAGEQETVFGAHARWCGRLVEQAEVEQSGPEQAE